MTDREMAVEAEATSGMERTSPPPLVSVVIPAYRAEEFIADSAGSVLRQEWRPLELIVVDDCSPDSTAARVEDMRSAAEAAGVELRLLSHEVNGGASQALRTGFAAAAGEYVCWLSADDAFTEPWKVSRQVRAMEESGSAASYYRDFCVGPTPDECVGVETALVPGRRELDAQVAAEPARLFVALMFHNAINGTSAMFRKADYEKTGGFDPTLRNVDPDGDIWLRLLALGLVIEPLDGAPIFYREHAAQTTQADSTMIAGIEAVRIRMVRALVRAGRLGNVARRGAGTLYASVLSRSPEQWPLSSEELATAALKSRSGMAAWLAAAGLWLLVRVRLARYPVASSRVDEILDRIADSPVWTAFAQDLLEER